MENLEIYGVLGILAFFGILEVISGYLNRSQRRGSDWIQEFGSFVMLAVLTKPAIVLLVYSLGQWWFPMAQNIWAGVNFWLLLTGFLLVDDFLQYWYHRFAHEYNWLWKLHRAHHQAEEMGFFISYRNAALYYVLMPNIWWIALMTFWGGAWPVTIGIILKQMIVVGSHSNTKWDQYLYRYPWLNPLTTVLERIIITPAFHFAHHGKSKQDSISDPNGNFGNMFSFWDQLFGTATFTRQYPTELGLLNDPQDHWTASIFYPLISSDKAESELARGHIKGDTTIPKPTRLHLLAGQKYLWCQCGHSQTQPFCDGSHQGTKHKPLLFSVEKDRKVRLCNCKLTQKGPFCDNSHLQIRK